MDMPLWINAFGKLLIAHTPDTWSAVVGGQDLRITTGIHEYSQFPQRQFYIEYTAYLPDKTGEIPLSCQLYFNLNNHWRLFLYTRHSGMLLSVNFTTAPPSDKISLKQTIKITTQSMSPGERVRTRDALVHRLIREGFHLEGDDLELGIYDKRVGNFVDTTPERFIKDFLRAGLIKGHYMANKGYRFPWLR